MTSTQKHRNRLKALENVFYAVSAFTLAVCLGLLVFLAVQDHQRIEQNERIQAFIREQAIKNQRLIEQVESCTTPTGKCYRDNRNRTNTVVMDINRVSILAAACADRDDTQTAAQIRKCVLDQLERE